jgi:hypothetical protein
MTKKKEAALPATRLESSNLNMGLTKADVISILAEDTIKDLNQRLNNLIAQKSTLETCIREDLIALQVKDHTTKVRALADTLSIPKEEIGRPDPNTDHLDLRSDDMFRLWEQLRSQIYSKFEKGDVEVTVSSRWNGPIASLDVFKVRIIEVEEITSEINEIRYKLSTINTTTVKNELNRMMLSQSPEGQALLNRISTIRDEFKQITIKKT